MSFILSFITDSFVIMAGDRRQTFVEENRFTDGHRKIYKVNNYIYGLAGSSELIDFFHQNNTSTDFAQFQIYSDNLFDNLEKTKILQMEQWERNKFDMTLQVGAIEGQKITLILYQITWREPGIIKAVIKDTSEIPCFVMPLDQNWVDRIENYIKLNHPQTEDKAIQIISKLMKILSNASVEISPDFDYEILKTY